MAPAPRPGAERGSLECELQAQGHVVWVDNVVPFDDAPIRDGAVAFMASLLMSESIAAVSNNARFGSGPSGAGNNRDPEFAHMPNSNRPATAGPAVSIEASDEATREVYSPDWMSAKK